MKNKICGIYCLEVVSTDKWNTAKYIGQSVDIYERRTEHFRQLYQNVHPNEKLQNVFNKYENNLLVFTILMECKRNERT